MKVTCPYCGQPAKLVDSSVVYHGRSYGKIWICFPCDAYVGTHRNSRNHVPLGRLANKHLRFWKREAHKAFDPLWREGEMTRTEAYAWLAKVLCIPKEKAHIGKFDVARCKQLCDICKMLEEI